MNVFGKESKSAICFTYVFQSKIFEEIGIGMLTFTFFSITMHGIDTAAEVYLEPFQTYMIEIFCENSYQLLALNWNKSSIIENWHGSNYAS